MTAMKTKTSREIGGTSRWMAPELLLSEDAKNTKASDVWAYGMTVLVGRISCVPVSHFNRARPQELITKKSPYSHLKIEGQVLGALIRHDLPSRPQTFEHPSHEQLWLICDKCWILDPSHRPEMDEVRRIVHEMTNKTCGFANLFRLKTKL